MTTTVYASDGGRRYHRNSGMDCPVFEAGRGIWDTDEWVPGWPSVRCVREMTVTDALGQGKEPCAECFPGQRAELHRSSSEDDFGHEPFEYDGVPICARCYTTEVRCSVDAFDNPHRHAVRNTVLWPCTSAVVLGLEPRGGAK